MKNILTYDQFIVERLETQIKNKRESEEENKIRHYLGSVEDLQRMVDDKAGKDTYPYREVEYISPKKVNDKDDEYPRQTYKRKS